MKKIFILTILTTLSSVSLASDEQIVCPNSSAEIVAMIQAPGTYCFQAKEIANQCAFGSSRDLKTAGAATAVCLKEAGKLSSADQSLLAVMENRCNQTYENQQGTMYQSMNAFCHLDAVSFIRNLQSDIENEQM